MAQLILLSFVNAEESMQEKKQSSLEDNKQNSTEISAQVEQLKQQLLTLNRELFILEEDLLFPASTQIALFVSVDTGKFFILDSVEVKIDNQNVAGFLYTERQRVALEQGGIQKVYLGNLTLGEHELTAIFIGVDNEGRRVKRAVTHSFRKEDEPLMIELKLRDNLSNYRAQIDVEEWVL